MEIIIVSIITNIAVIVAALINNGRLKKNSEKLESTETKVDSVVQSAVKTERQFINNGGSSMKDQMDRIERRLGNHETTMAALATTDSMDRAGAIADHKEIWQSIDSVKRLAIHIGEEMRHISRGMDRVAHEVDGEEDTGDTAADLAALMEDNDTSE